MPNTMRSFWKKWKRCQFCPTLFPLLFIFVPVIFTLVLLSPGLPEVEKIPPRSRLMASKRSMEGENRLGELGLAMIGMLPENLAFTAFVPSEKAFDRVLKLQSNRSLMADKLNDTLAILSRIMGFCAVPRSVVSESVPALEEFHLDSVSGFRICMLKLADGTLLANNVRAEQVDIRKGEIIVHVMEGVIMDAEFQQSFIFDQEE